MLQEFAYFAPEDKSELLDFLSRNSEKSRILAGGTDLIVELNGSELVPDFVVDIKKIGEFRKISFDRKKGLSIGSTVTCIELMNDSNVLNFFPLLADAAGRIGSYQLRNRATIGGNLCTASPCADMGCSLLSLGAEIELVSEKKSRIIPLKTFFTGVKSTQIQPNEVVRRIKVPADSANSSWGMEKLKRIKGHDLALVSVAIARKNGVTRVGVGSCAPTPIVLPDFVNNESAEEICAVAATTIKPITDVRASADFRLFMVQQFITGILAQMS